MAHLAERDAEVQRRRRLGDAALLVREGDHARRDAVGRRGLGGRLDRRSAERRRHEASRLTHGLAHDERLRLGHAIDDLDFGLWCGGRPRRPRRSRAETNESHDLASFTAVPPTPSRPCQSSPSQ